MWIFLLSFLATESVHSASLGYPYSSFLAYSPQKSASVNGYLRYLDNYRAGDITGHNDPQSLYAVRQIKYINGATPTLVTWAAKNSEELSKARETYLRTASMQQYQLLKNDINTLRAEGKEPSAEKLSKLQMLEKIAFTSDFSLIAELPEIKSTLHDLETSISGLYREPVQQSPIQSTNIKQDIGEIKTYVGNTNIPTIVIEETPEQKQAREDHLRIYKEQIAHLKQLELEHQKYIQQANVKPNIPQSENITKEITKNIDNSKALTELEQATQEHFRLWNEAKRRAEQAGNENIEKVADKISDQQQISAEANNKSFYNPKQPSKHIEIASNLQGKHQSSDVAKLSQEHIQLSEQEQVVDTPEVVRAREEHLRIVNEAIQKSQQEQIQQAIINPKDEKRQQAHNLKESSPAINYSAEQSIVKETAEVKKAREEHLRLVQEANQRAQYVEQQELKYNQGSQLPILKSQFEIQRQYPAHHADHLRLVKNDQLSAYSFPKQEQLAEAQVSGETAEVQRAREEHLRIFNSIKAHTELEQAKHSSRVFPHAQSSQKPISDFATEEERLLELERLREADRLQKEHELLELDRLRESERLAEEKRQMEAELMRLKLEEEERLETERLLEEKRMQQEQEELKTIQSGDYQDVVIRNDSPSKQEQIAIIPGMSSEQTRSHQFGNNPFLKVGQASSETESHKDNPVTSLSDNAVPNIRYIQSQHHPAGSKHQYDHIKDDKVKNHYHDSAGYQPADTAVALIALEKATNDHFRAHELALEQFRLARIQNPSVKDCS